MSKYKYPRSDANRAADVNYNEKRGRMSSAMSACTDERNAFPDACKKVKLTQREVLLMVSQNIEEVIEILKVED